MSDNKKHVSIAEVSLQVYIQDKPVSIPPLKYEVLNVKPSELCVDLAYQRSLTTKSISLIEKIVKEWSWSSFTPPKVTRYEDGTLFVIDGQHTSIAAHLHPDIDSIPVFQVTSKLNRKQKADAFVRHNTDRTAVHQIDIYKAKLESGDELATSLMMAQRRSGIEFVATTPTAKTHHHHSTSKENRGYPCSCIRTCLRLVSSYGPMHMRIVFDIGVEAKLPVLTAYYITAISSLVRSKSYDDEVVSLAIRDYPMEDLHADVLFQSRKTGQTQAVTAASLISSKCEELLR